MTSTIEFAKQAAKGLSNEPDVDSVFLGGSITAGLGNPTSDVDIFLLLNREVDSGPKQYIVEGQRLDVETYSIDDLLDAVTSVSEYILSNSNIGKLWELDKKFDLVSRFLTGITVKNSEALTNAKERCDERIDQIRQNMINYYVLAASSDREDFLGSTLDGDFLTASYNGQVLMTSAGKALTSAHSDYYFGRKWVYKQLGRSIDAQFPLTEFSHFQHGTWHSEKNRGAERLLEFAQNCTAYSQFPELIDIFLWSEDEGFLKKNPSYSLFRQGNDFILHWELHQQFKVGYKTALLWALINGSEASTLLTTIQDSPQLSDLYGEVSASDIEMMIGRFNDMGIIGSRQFTIEDIAGF